jgi:SAM-dependent methyltransferase
MAEPLPSLLSRDSGLFVCPACGGPLGAAAQRPEIACAACGRTFGCDEGIPLLYWSDEADEGDDVTEVVKSFYEQHPFPDYEDLDSSATLKEKARRGLFARLLDEQIPDSAWVLEAGCGTGQLGNLLALTPSRTVVSTDVSLSSLRLGQAFKRQNQIEASTFVQMNLFRPALRPASFDVVICTGVLHHTSAPRRGFRILGRLVKPGGYILVGLYNRFGRLATDLRRLVFRFTGDRFQFLDPRLRAPGLGRRRHLAWFMDQYRHPHESKHTMGEVIAWFEDAGFEVVNAIPKTRAFEAFTPGERLFTPRPAGSALDRLLVQLWMLLSGGREGGLFVLVGRRRQPESAP